VKRGELLNAWASLVGEWLIIDRLTSSKVLFIFTIYLLNLIVNYDDL
jgi:hypothetical protein